VSAAGGGVTNDEGFGTTRRGRGVCTAPTEMGSAIAGPGGTAPQRPIVGRGRGQHHRGRWDQRDGVGRYCRGPQRLLQPHRSLSSSPKTQPKTIVVARGAPNREY
jgi:hypothetical protein